MAVTPRAGPRYNHITILQPVTSGSTQTWSTFGTAWASIIPQSGNEVISATQLGAANVEMTVVTIPYQKGIRPRMRLLFGTRTLEIASVVNVEEARRSLELVCKETVS